MWLRTPTPIGVQSLIGQKSPEFSLKSLDDKEVKLSQFKDKLVILDFFTTFSKTSQKQILLMEKLYQKYSKPKDNKPQGLVILGITSEKDKAKVKKFVTENKITFPILAEGAKAFKDYKATQLPTVLFVNKDGSICSAHLGAVTYNEAKFDAEITGFMGGKTVRK